ncbi:MAG: Co2+/Mg2+ efflux protein ApaG [Phycisphaeraceae bacterium]|nr:Co2+/Mg2+ efflux protein ApaG [Phycisphaeraceae bacterium]MCW5753775.1 Co2+/Mg2+ efflux protein ApaG [Phycisphaeraceae bacterium]
MNECVGSESCAHGIRVLTRPFFVPGGAVQYGCAYLFAYEITIVNEGPEEVQLLWRRWLIEDATGLQREVTGAGVVGRQPKIAPGERFEYQSACPLETPQGSMEGAFTFQRADGSMFETPVARFLLVAAEQA